MTTPSHRFIPVLNRIKSEYENAIKTATFNGNSYTNGNKAKEAFIRSSQLIRYIHEFIKNELARNGVSQNKIYPPINQSTPEIQLYGFLKAKNQDICILPEPPRPQNAETISFGLLNGETDPLGKNLMEKSISINIRSQLSSLDKNFDTLFERTFAEALNLHLRTSKITLGEVYLIPTHEYQNQPMLQNKIAYKSVSKLEKYIQAFQSINNRMDFNIDYYKYERIWLIIVDFKQTPPKLYSDKKSLIDDGLIPNSSGISLDKLSIYNFVEDLLGSYTSRFDINNLH